ncbi:MAG: hypothetical protein ACRC6M_18405 [Microcystaceae cyanobacterium]
MQTPLSSPCDATDDQTNAVQTRKWYQAKLISVGITPTGYIAIGVVPMGIVAIGIVPMGVISIGTVAMGAIAAGFVSMGMLTFGQVSMSLNGHQGVHPPQNMPAIPQGEHHNH